MGQVVCADEGEIVISVRSFTVALCALLLGMCAALAQTNYPNRVVRIVVPSTSGGGDRA